MFIFVSIFPAYDSRILLVGSPLPVCCRILSRRVEMRRLRGSSGTVTTEPSSFHSGLAESLGSWIWREMGRDCQRKERKKIWNSTIIA